MESLAEQCMRLSAPLPRLHDEKVPVVVSVHSCSRQTTPQDTEVVIVLNIVLCACAEYGVVCMFVCAEYVRTRAMKNCCLLLIHCTIIEVHDW